MCDDDWSSDKEEENDILTKRDETKTKRKARPQAIDEFSPIPQEMMEKLRSDKGMVPQEPSVMKKTRPQAIDGFSTITQKWMENLRSDDGLVQHASSITEETGDSGFDEEMTGNSSSNSGSSQIPTLDNADASKLSVPPKAKLMKADLNKKLPALPEVAYPRPLHRYSTFVDLRQPQTAFRNRHQQREAPQAGWNSFARRTNQQQKPVRQEKQLDVLINKLKYWFGM